ncbi:hypothetical protein EGR_07937 [Echinococcus granulosus]|uniref:Uncharacterized protein n=1 Tax=Echinococcus granulosus TaxID=6210 RepID=W6U7H9_ECHGR|nr:hypothetical protein EGR_07937 [Echinococcus granulosus]EUB57188.1 hypothetical protein EGR_07937 [Echinococcus granulosus]
MIPKLKRKKKNEKKSRLCCVSTISRMKRRRKLLPPPSPSLPQSSCFKVFSNFMRKKLKKEELYLPKFRKFSPLSIGIKKIPWVREEGVTSCHVTNLSRSVNFMLKMHIKEVTGSKYKCALFVLCVMIDRKSLFKFTSRPPPEFKTCLGNILQKKKMNFFAFALTVCKNRNLPCKKITCGCSHSAFCEQELLQSCVDILIIGKKLHHFKCTSLQKVRTSSVYRKVNYAAYFCAKNLNKGKTLTRMKCSENPKNCHGNHGNEEKTENG